MLLFKKSKLVILDIFVLFLSILSIVFYYFFLVAESYASFLRSAPQIYCCNTLLFHIVNESGLSH